MTYLLDTNVISELRKVRNGLAAPGVVAWEQTVRPAELFLSVITMQELEIGVLLLERKAPEQGQVLRAWLDGQVLPAFADRILPVDTRVARQSAQLHVPDPKPVRDGLIAATALVHGLVVVTRNVRDFAGTGVAVVNPWEDKK
ncbi:type II toxin-antitoxin system VapC family toxin [uncultured Deinococcus sp.]|uniref:type II toxin-antitoxin system VapC family toxin n=1 Tax=uncultured Deinococcus sp. TaxID=158789 RepID=UPI0025DF0048|nr:type II toxin-antitoxin system VapC family toxin [uncultured Deinococcus sp.]